MGTLNFRVGDNLPIILANIAQEKLIYKLDPQGAIDVFRDSLGIDNDDLILGLISGKDLCARIDIDTQEFEVIKRKDDPENPYPILNAEYIASSWLEQEIEICLGYSGVFNKSYYPSYFLSNPKSIHLDVSVDLDFLIRVFSGQRNQCKDYIFDAIMDRFENREGDYITEMMALKDALISCKDWFFGAIRKIDVIKFMIASKFINIENVNLDLNKLEVELAYLYNHLLDFMIVADLDDLSEDYKAEIGTWLKINDNISDLVSHKILPVDITEGYDAGWLSPEGLFYGMNGNMNDMLHIQISDLLKEEGIIPEDERSPCGWLEDNGWVKIHGDWVLFQCQNHKFEIDKSMTDKQIDAIVNYGKSCYKDGFLRFGYRMARLSVATFKYLDNPRKNEIFML